MEQHFLNGFGITTESWYLTYDQLAREYQLVDHTGTVWNAWESYLAMYLQLMQWSFRSRISPGRLSAIAGIIATNS